MSGKRGFPPRKGWLWLVLAGLTAAMALLISRDLSLEVPVPPPSGDGESHVEIEKIEVERRFDGDLWRLMAPVTIRQGNETEVQSAEIQVETPEGEKLHLKTPRARFDQDMDAGSLESPEGQMTGEGFSYSWQAGIARWEGKERRWQLSGDVRIEGDGLVMDARSGTLLPGGNVRLEEEVRVQWRYDTPDD